MRTYPRLRRYTSLLFIIFLFPFLAKAQNVAINGDGSSPDATAILDVKSTNKGLLVPRMTTTQRIGITSPATGLLVFDTNTGSFWYYSGAAWSNIAIGWGLTGNSGTNATTHFIGTTDNQPLNIRFNNMKSGSIEDANTGWGYLTLLNNTTGQANTAIGAQALSSNTTGGSNTALGRVALYSNTIGRFNTAIGNQSLTFNLSGIQNTANGYNSLIFNETGNNNTANGYGALDHNSTGNNNTAVGFQTMTVNNTGSGNTAIGANANVDVANLTNATAIGAGAIVNASNRVRIGNGAVTVIEGQVPFTSPSDGRFKYNVQEDVKGLDFILRLRPVTYNFDVKKFDDQYNQAAGRNTLSDFMQASYTKASAIRRTGFIAQEVEQAADQSGYNFSGIIKPETERDHYSLSYESFVVPMVKAIQELSKKADKAEAQQKEIVDLKVKVKVQESEITELKTMMLELKKEINELKNSK